MSLNINYCRLCLQKIEGLAETLSKDSKAFTIVTSLFPVLDIPLVINSKLCIECFKYAQLANVMIKNVTKNEQKILLDLQNTQLFEKITCRLCLNNEKLEVAFCLFKNTNETARQVIEIAIMNLDFDIFRKPVICNSCWQIVMSIYLFKKKCFAMERILKCYCATNGINSLDRKKLEIVSLSYKENLDEDNFLSDINARSIANSNLTQSIVNTQNMYLNNLTEDKDDVFKEVPFIANIINVKSESLKEEHGIEIKEENLCEFIESDENVGMAVNPMNLGSIGRIQQTDISSNTSEILINKTENMGNICHSIQKSPSQSGVDTDKIIHTEDKDNVFEEVPYIANILNVDSELLKEEDEIEIKEEKLCKFIESDENVAAGTMNVETIGRIKQTEITSNASEIIINKTENMENICHSIQTSPSQPGIDREEIIHGSNDGILKKCLKKRKLRMQLLTDKEQFLLCEKCDYRTKSKRQWNRHSLLHKDNGELHNCSKRKNLQSHMRNHDSEHQTRLSFKCDECPYATIEEVNIKLHLKTHQSEKSILKCSECYYITTCSNSLKKHMETHASKPKTFKCQKCSFQTNRKSSLVSHLLIHQDSCNFSCDKCSFQTKRKADLAIHMLLHQENYNFKCEKCSYQAKRKAQLVSHMLLHQENYNFKCEKCSYKTKRKFDLVKHMLIHQDICNFSCDKCSYKTKRKFDLVNHMLLHQENYNFKCEKCSYRAKNRTYLVKHMLIHQDICNFSCDKCGYKTKRKFDLVKHMLIHQDICNFSCDKCSYKTKRKFDLVNHMVIHQDFCNFSCDKCNYKTKRKFDLVNHMVIHQDFCNFSCDKCSYQTNKKAHLVAHMLIHEENCNYFKCQKCSYQTKRKNDLAKHMLIHQENYNFKCEECSYRAKKRNYLIRHMLIHQDNCDFSCYKCSYKTKRKTTLVSHMLIHQDICNFSCDKCSYKTKRKSDLVRHMLIHQTGTKCIKN